jgi:hypothetical protein
VASRFIGFLVVIVLAFVAMSAVPSLLTNSGPLLFIVLAVLALVFVPALRRLGLALVVMAIMAYMAWLSVYSRSQAPMSGVPSASAAPLTMLQSAEETASSWWNWGDPGTWPLFVEGAQDPCCVHASDVGQGEQGDCFLLSALAAVAEVSPGTIRQAIRPLGKGTYAVRLHDETTLQPYDARVDASFPERPWVNRLAVDTSSPYFHWLPRFLHAMPGDEDVETWPMVFEKAYAAPLGYDAAYNGGGNSLLAMQRITGKKGAGWLLAPDVTVLTPQDRAAALGSAASLEKSLVAAIADDDAITAGTLSLCDATKSDTLFRCIKTLQENPLFAPSGGKPYGMLVQSHAYYLKRYDASSKTITLGNPWAGAPDVPLSLGDFISGFRAIYYDKPAINKDCTCG